MTVPLLEVDNLSKDFRAGGHTVRAVDDVSFLLRQGETLAVVGESGSGKSTRARIIAGLVAPDTGDVVFGGRSHRSRRTQAERRALHREIQLIQQDTRGSLDPRMRVGAQIDEAMIIHGIGDRAERAERRESLLTRVGLDVSLAARFPAALSGGQRQRIVIARALAVMPRLLVCDEPVSALDDGAQSRIVSLLQQLQRQERLTMIFISHDLHLAARLADRVAVLYKGEIVDFGPMLPTLRAPSHPYTRALIDAVRPRQRAARRDTFSASAAS